MCACAGSNNLGQLGNGGNTSSAVPVEVSDDHTFKSFSTGGFYTCGVDSGGRAWCWGEYLELTPAACLLMPGLHASVSHVVCVHVQVMGSMASWAMEATHLHLCLLKYRVTTYFCRSALVAFMRAAWTPVARPGAGVSFLYVTPSDCLFQTSMLLSHMSNIVNVQVGENMAS